MIEPYLALARATIGEIDEARKALELLVATGVDSGFMLSNAIVNLAEILRVGGQAAASLARANEALAIAQRIGNVPTIAFANEICGRLAAGREQWTEAEAAPRCARSSCRAPDHPESSATFDALAEVAAGLESYEERACWEGGARHACSTTRSQFVSSTRIATRSELAAEVTRRAAVGIGGHVGLSG